MTKMHLLSQIHLLIALKTSDVEKTKLLTKYMPQSNMEAQSRYSIRPDDAPFDNENEKQPVYWYHSGQYIGG